MLRSLTLFAIALALSGCVLAPAGRGAPTVNQRPDADPVLEVRNDHVLPVRIFTFWLDSRYFLGELSPKQTGSFRIPRELVTSGHLRLLVDPIGSADEYTTEPVEIGNGRYIRWHVRTYLHGSRLSVM